MPPAEITTRDTEILITGGQRQHFDGRTRRIHRLPQLLRFNKHKKEDYYTPKFVSFGPYYRGLPQLGMAEEFKGEVLTMLVSSSGKDKQFFYSQIFKVVDQIRNCYVGVSTAEYDDKALAKMMLLDASFAIYLMKIYLGEEEKNFHFCQHFGMALLSFAIQDMYLVENQIPLRVIKLLIELNTTQDNKEGTMLLNFLSSFVFGDIDRLTRIPGEDENPPLHLLGAFQRILSEEWGSAEKRIEESKEVTKQNYQPRSVTDLKANGIVFKPSSGCLKNIKFKSYTFYGQLQLPIWFFSSYSKLFFTHLIAYEVSPESNVGMNITCYVNFLKSLIVKPEDVKELRERKIIFSSQLDTDEQILKVIKEIDTCGVDFDNISDAVKMRIDEHCSIWIAELIHTYFTIRWSFTATILLVLTFLQTYYTINPSK